MPLVSHLSTDNRVSPVKVVPSLEYRLYTKSKEGTTHARIHRFPKVTDNLKVTWVVPDNSSI